MESELSWDGSEVMTMIIHSEKMMGIVYCTLIQILKNFSKMRIKVDKMQG
jgi:hypothetical protein